MSRNTPPPVEKAFPAGTAYIDEGDEALDEFSDAIAPFTLKMSDDACGVRLDKVLSGLIPAYSRSRIQQWIEAGYVTVDGAPAKTKMTVLGDELVVVTPQIAPEEKAFQPEAMDLDIVHEDKALIVINKPAGLVVHPAAGNWTGTLLNGLLHHLPSLANVPRAGIVHRLDKDTSGLSGGSENIGGTDRSGAAIAGPYRQASVSGAGMGDAAIVRANRRRHGPSSARSHQDGGIGKHDAKPALTHYRRLAVGALDGRAVSLMHCRLETGRTHQIRVHMQSLGFALVGDALYGKPHLMPFFPRQALQAARLGLNHPVSGKYCVWSAALPPDFAELLVRAGIDQAVSDALDE